MLLVQNNLEGIVSELKKIFREQRPKFLLHFCEVGSHRFLPSAILAVYIDNRFLDTKDSDFVQIVTCDVAHYLKTADIDSVLVFPPVESYFRLLIHKTIEESFSDLCSFSIGERDERRTVVCLQGSVLRAILHPVDSCIEVPDAVNKVRRTVAMSQPQWDKSGWEENQPPLHRAGRGRGRGRGRAKRYTDGDPPPPVGRMYSDREVGGGMYSDRSDDHQLASPPQTEQRKEAEEKPERRDRPNSTRTRPRRAPMQVYVPRARRQEYTEKGQSEGQHQSSTDGSDRSSDKHRHSGGSDHISKQRKSFGEQDPSDLKEERRHRKHSSRHENDREDVNSSTTITTSHNKSNDERNDLEISQGTWEEEERLYNKGQVYQEVDNGNRVDSVTSVGGGDGDDDSTKHKHRHRERSGEAKSHRHKHNKKHRSKDREGEDGEGGENKSHRKHRRKKHKGESREGDTKAAGETGKDMQVCSGNTTEGETNLTGGECLGVYSKDTGGIQFENKLFSSENGSEMAIAKTDCEIENQNYKGSSEADGLMDPEVKTIGVSRKEEQLQNVEMLEEGQLESDNEEETFYDCGEYSRDVEQIEKGHISENKDSSCTDNQTRLSTRDSSHHILSEDNLCPVLSHAIDSGYKEVESCTSTDLPVDSGCELVTSSCIKNKGDQNITQSNSQEDEGQMVQDLELHATNNVAETSEIVSSLSNLSSNGVTGRNDDGKDIDCERNVRLQIQSHLDYSQGDGVTNKETSKDCSDLLEMDEESELEAATMQTQCSKTDSLSQDQDTSLPEGQNSINHIQSNVQTASTDNIQESPTLGYPSSNSQNSGIIQADTKNISIDQCNETFSDERTSETSAHHISSISSLQSSEISNDVTAHVPQVLSGDEDTQQIPKAMDIYDTKTTSIHCQINTSAKNMTLLEDTNSNEITEVLSSANTANMEIAVNEGSAAGEMLRDLTGDDKETVSMTTEPELPKVNSCGEAGTSQTGVPDSGEVEDEEESWDTMFDDDGEALEPNLMQELTVAVGKVKVTKPQFDYLDYQPKEPDLDYDAYSHLIEIYDFPTELQTRDLVMAFQEFKDKGFDIKWVDDNHAIGVFSGAFGAKSALSLKHPLMKVRPIGLASRQTKLKAKRCTEFLQPYKPRPETVASVARNLVAGALGLKSNIPREKREEERRKLKEARELKKNSRKQKEQAWAGSFGKCAMDDV